MSSTSMMLAQRRVALKSKTRPAARRVAMVSNAYYPADPRLRRQAEALAAHGYPVHVVCQREPGQPVEQDIHGVHVQRVGGTRYRGASLPRYLASNATFLLKALATLAREQIRHGYAAVQVYSMPEALVFSAIGPRFGGVPLIYDAGDLTTELFASKFQGRSRRWLPAVLRAQERLCFRFADLIITVHEEYRRRLVARGVATERLRIVMNLPDGRLFERAVHRPRASSRDCPTEFLLVHHGSLVHRYGADLAIRAVAQLRDRIPALRLRLYGDGDLRPALVSLVDELALADRVVVNSGYVPLEDLVPELAAAEVAIVPHRADAFTDTILPNKLLEYLALGLPTIVTRTRTVEHHVPKDVVEYCEPNSVDALADAIERLWAQPERRRNLALRALEFSQTHSWDDAAMDYCAIVDDLVARRR